LRPVAYLAGHHAAAQLREFLAAHRRTRQVQDALLRELIVRHRETAFGRDHGFDRIRSYEDFAAAVPVGDYETLRPYMRRVYEGEPTALLPGGEAVLMFSRSSGTTGEPKHVPVTRRFLGEMRRGWNIFGVKVLRDHPRGWLRPILQLSSPMRESLSPTGLPCGAISGLLASTQKPIVRRMYVARPEAVGERDPGARYYATLRCAIGRDVGIVTTANPSSAIKLIETGQQHAERLIRDVSDGTFTPPGDAANFPSRRFRADRGLARRLERGLAADGELRATHFWKLAFMTLWTGGTLKLYLPRLRELYGEMPIRDIGLLASEGRFSLPTVDGTAAGVAEITANFLEFIPAEAVGSANRPTLRADELDVGGEYFLVITNWAGLWRYNIDDRVRVIDRLGDSPVFEFLSRGRHTANVTGEKITEHQVVEAMERAGGGRIVRFEMQARFALVPYYELRLEPTEGLDAAALADRMDEELSRLNIEYASKRRSGRLGAIRFLALAPGSLRRIESERIAARKGRGEQYKHQYLLTEVLGEQAGSPG